MKAYAIKFSVSTVVFLLMISALPGSSLLQPDITWAAGNKAGKSPPIHIKSDSMEAMDKNGTVVFKGNVVAIRGNLTINSDTLRVVYENTPARNAKSGSGKKTGKHRRLKKIVATGHVKIIQGRKVGTGKQAVYDKNAEKIVLSGDAQVWEGSNRIKGTKITLYINENRSVVESSGRQKVEATVYTD